MRLLLLLSRLPRPARPTRRPPLAPLARIRGMNSRGPRCTVTARRGDTSCSESPALSHCWVPKGPTPGLSPVVAAVPHATRHRSARDGCEVTLHFTIVFKSMLCAPWNARCREARGEGWIAGGAQGGLLALQPEHEPRPNSLLYSPLGYNAAHPARLSISTLEIATQKGILVDGSLSFSARRINSCVSLCLPGPGAGCADAGTCLPGISCRRVWLSALATFSCNASRTSTPRAHPRRKTFKKVPVF